jgi:hypothetical protein
MLQPIVKTYRKSSSSTKPVLYLGLALLGLWCLPVGVGQAQIINLNSGNSSVSINTASQAGMYNWIVGGQNQLNQQWFWYRIGSSGPEASINTISAPTINQLSASIAQTTYANSLFSVTILYSLVGGSAQSGASDLSEQISIQNLTASTLNYHFFQYADFNLGGTPNNDTGQLDQFGQMYGGVVQYDGYGCQISEYVDTAVSRAANHGQIGNGSTLLNLLNDGGTTTFNGSTATSGNVNWGLEWDVNIAAGGTLIISKDLNIVGGPVGTVPEPGTWALLLLGMLSFGLFRYRLSRRTS